MWREISGTVGLFQDLFDFGGLKVVFFGLENCNCIDYHYGNTGYGVFQAGGTKVERFLHNNQYAQRKSLNFGLMASCQK